MISYKCKDSSKRTLMFSYLLLCKSVFIAKTKKGLSDCHFNVVPIIFFIIYTSTAEKIKALFHRVLQLFYFKSDACMPVMNLVYSWLFKKTESAVV